MEFSSPNIKNFLIFSLKKAFLMSRKTELSRPKTKKKFRGELSRAQKIKKNTEKISCISENGTF